MALEVGIVGLPGAGKTTLFTALTKTGGAGFGKENVGMASIADDRLEQLAALVGARKITPATIRVQDVPGAGEAQLGNLRQVDALLVVLAGFGAGADPASDLETFKLELLVADRDHVEKRLERVQKQAKSGDAKVRAEAVELERILAHLDAGGALRDYPGELPPELAPLTTKPLLAVENGPSRKAAASSSGSSASSASSLPSIPPGPLTSGMIGFVVSGSSSGGSSAG